MSDRRAVLTGLTTFGPCRSVAAEIRAVAMTTGTDLDAIDRAGLFALATLVERRGTAARAGRRGVENAIEELIGMLDAFDVPGMDREPWLGAPERHPGGGWGFGCRYDPGVDQGFWGCGNDDDREDDTADAEHTLGWAANVGQLALGHGTEDGDNTAPERHGEGFVRCGLDDEEAQPGFDPPERETLPTAARRASRAAAREVRERLEEIIRRKQGGGVRNPSNVIVPVRR